MSRLPWRTLFWLAMIGGGAYVAWSPNPDPVANPTSAPTVAGAPTPSAATLIADLNSDDDTVHDRAFRELVSLGAEAIPALEATALEVRRTHRRRVMDVLEQYLLASDIQLANAAETRLEHLAATAERHIANDASRVLQDNFALRHARAMSLVTARNGRLLDSQPQGLDPDLHRDFLNILHHSNGKGVVLSGDWKGGDTELRHVRRLFPNDFLHVFITEATPITRAGILAMAQGRGSMRVRHPHSACLGIYADNTLRNGRVVALDVNPRGPAFQAGMADGDALLSLNGVEIRFGDDIERHLLQCNPGEIVEMQAERGSQRMTFSIQLGSDYRSRRCACFDRLRKPAVLGEQTVLTPVPADMSGR